MSVAVSETLPATALEVLPWAKWLMDYSDAVVNSLPENEAALDWRPTDDAGGWYLSIREQAMHIVDERLEVVSNITGQDFSGMMFLQDYGGTEKPWTFKPGTRAQIIESLKAGRAAADEMLSMPPAQLLESTDALRAKFSEWCEKLKEQGKDEELAKLQARGPGRIINMVMFLMGHEQSHRSVLQHLLRRQGHEVARLA